MKPEDRKIVNDIIVWDTATWSQALDYWKPLIERFGSNDLAVEIGARAGGLSLFFALNGMRSLSTDLSNPAIHGKPVHNKYEVGNNITYLVADATSLPLKAETVSVVGMKSVLGSIGRDNNLAKARQAVSEAHRILKPGGLLLFAENLTASFLHMALRKKFVPWAEHYHYFSLTQLDDLFRQFSHFNYATRGFMALMGRNETQRRILACVDRIIHPLTPRKWRYVAYGFARK